MARFMSSSRHPHHSNHAHSDDAYAHLTQSKMKVLKCGRRGNPREIQLSLSSNHRELVWSSNALGPKFGKTNKVEIFRIKRVTAGQNTAQFNRAPASVKEKKDLAFSVFYSTVAGEEMTLDCVALNSADFTLLTESLNHLITSVHAERAAQSPDELYLRDMWDRGDADGSGTMTTQEIIHLVSSMNISMPNSTIKKIFKSFDDDDSGTLNFDEFRMFIAVLRERKELRRIWALALEGKPLSSSNLPSFEEDTSAADPNDELLNRTLPLRSLVDFWRQTQFDESISEEKMIAMLDSACTTKLNMETKLISYNMFSSLFCTNENDIFNPEKEHIYMDMTRPLSHYFIASSHNTYLEGDQLMSNSSVQRYIDDMTCGCRCVELDCWDGDKGVPVIYHGHTLTTKILFSDVIDAIREYGFKTTPYPLILSIENHCSLPQQQKLAQIMKDGLGNLLALPLQGKPTELPSPEELKYKVLVKGKRIGSVDADDDDDDEEKEDGEAAPPKKGDAAEAKAPKLSTHPELSEITYLSTGKVHGFDETGNAQIPCDNMCSFSEGKTIKILKSADLALGWTLHNQKHLSRIYPKGTRVDSSNYNPVPAWTAGNQLVALNYQTGDIPMHVNRGKFRENGQCGYVLKPEHMLSPSLRNGRGLRIVLTILSGHQLPKPGAATKGEVIDPLVVVSLHGLPEDEAELRTRTVNDNGFNPYWNERKEFLVRYPDVAVINIEVMDEDVTTNEFIGFAALPVSCLRGGLRECKLYDAHGRRDRDYHFATLTVHVEVEQVYIV